MNGESWILTVVYNPSRILDQRFVWQELSGMANLNFPWILIGDFNDVTSLNEIQGGSLHYYNRKACEFSNFIASNNFLDVKSTGSMFTWCNNQLGMALRWARFDLCFINS